MRRVKEIIERGQSIADAVRDAVMEKTSVGYITDIAKCPGEKGIKLVKIQDTIGAMQKEIMIAIDAVDLEISKKKKFKVGDTVRYTVYRDPTFKIRGVRYGSISSVL